MNCPQCQAANGQDAVFCGNCGGRLAAASAPAAAGGYTSSSGTPLGYGPAASPTGYEAPGGYNAPPSYGAPGGYNNAPPPYGPPVGGQVPTGYPPQGQYPPSAPGGAYPQRPASPAGFDLARLTKIDKVVAGASLVALISIWLPWYNLSLGYGYGNASASGTAGHGWLWLEFVVALVLIAYLVTRAAWETPPFKLPVAHAPLLVVGTGIQLLLILVAFFDIPYANEGVGWGWAAFVGLIAALAAAGPVIYPAVRSYLDSRKATGPQGY